MRLVSNADQLERLRNQRATLAEFGLIAFRSDDIEALLHEACARVSAALDVDLVKVLEHIPQQHQFLLKAGINWKPGVVGHVRFADGPHSPGGFALLTAGPVISPDVEREDRFDIPLVLREHGVRSMINVPIAGGREPYGVLEVDARDRRQFEGDEIAFLTNYANLLAAALERMWTHKELDRIAREQSLLARELSHRVKNALSVVQAIALQTSVQERSAADYRDALVGRIQALAIAESLLLEDHADAADLLMIAQEVLQPYRDTSNPQRIAIHGSAVHLPTRKARMFGLVLHELATNAAKYGALSAASGHVEVAWHINQLTPGTARLELVWREADGPEVRPPQRKGFGTRLLEGVVAHELGGTAQLSYLSSGLEYRLSFAWNG